MSENFAVIIPYYQKEPIFLKHAVQSILNQSVPKGVKVMIVITDDGSPCPPQLSLESLTIDPPFHVVIESQINGGVASARNLGLNYLQTIMPKYCAFLDSDDEWLPGHIDEAVKNINAGADFWFTDTYDEDEQTTFAYFEFMTSRHTIGKDAQPITATLTAKEAFDELLKNNLVHTSTVVFRFNKNPLLRFDTNLKIASEDYLFWLSAITTSSEVKYTTALKGRRGRGVSIYRSGFDWDSPNIIDIEIYQTLFREKVSKLFTLTAEQNKLNEIERKAHYNKLVFFMLRQFLKKPKSLFPSFKKANTLLNNFKRELPASLLRLPRTYADIKSEKT